MSIGDSYHFVTILQNDAKYTQEERKYEFRNFAGTKNIFRSFCDALTWSNGVVPEIFSNEEASFIFIVLYTLATTRVHDTQLTLDKTILMRWRQSKK